MSRRSRRRRISPRLALAVLAVLVWFGIFLSQHFQDERQRASAPTFSSPECRAAYEKMYDEPELDLRVVFGYKDARPARFVADRYEHLNFVQKILARCEGEDRACGFVRSDLEADLFLREVPGPDGKPRMVRLRIVHASVGPDDAKNRKNPFQAWRSRYARETFVDSFAEADAVFYNGHSRAGGGPDFDPPLLTASGEVDFSRYRREQPGIRQVLESLGKKPHPGLIGFFSCASDQLFVGRVSRVAPDVGLIASSELLYFSDAMESLTAAVSGLLEMRCEPEYSEKLNAFMIGRASEDAPATEAQNEQKTRAAAARVFRFF